MIKPNEAVLVIRNRLRLKRDEFAEKLDVSMSTIQRIEKGESPITIKFLKKMQEVFGVDPNFVVNGTGEIFLEKTA